MTAHKHAKMIKAKADNMDLVVLSKSNVGINGNQWTEVANKFFFPSCESESYFLCLPQHKEACLHWLNGGKIQYKTELIPEFKDYQPNIEFGLGSIFMQTDFEIRIKPRKEKRWIAACNSGHNCIDKLFDNKNQAKEFVTAFYPNNRVGDFQFIEIEIEVEV